VRTIELTRHSSYCAVRDVEYRHTLSVTIDVHTIEISTIDTDHLTVDDEHMTIISVQYMVGI